MAQIWDLSLKMYFHLKYGKCSILSMMTLSIDKIFRMKFRRSKIDEMLYLEHLNL